MVRGHNDRPLHTGRLGSRTYIAAGVGLYVAGVHGLAAGDRQTCHSFADRDPLNDCEDRWRKLATHRFEMQHAIILQEV